jgi:hypothetical protein
MLCRHIPYPARPDGARGILFSFASVFAEAMKLAHTAQPIGARAVVTTREERPLRPAKPGLASLRSLCVLGALCGEQP